MAGTGDCKRATPRSLIPRWYRSVVFRSPVARTSCPGKQAIERVLGTVGNLFASFTCHRQFVREDGLSVVLEFSAEVAGKALKGIDMIRFDGEGKIVEFEVMVRPAALSDNSPQAAAIP